ncbi:hydrolase [Microvirga sp. W0021]|uniref:Hydrolase n=1 Tax=Hohaiivirga grylli TaxID=3133970 RepID=A0ABV0BHH5_9HYPH
MPLKAQNSHLLLIDFQERLMPVVQNVEQVIRNAAILVEAAHMLKIPVTVSEQYPKGLGLTIAPLRERIPAEDIIEKITFSAFREEKFHDVLETNNEADRHQLIITGAETHICVLQTALDALEAGYDVFMVSDAVSSRTQASIDAARERFIAAGGRWVTTEMVVFEWLEKAGTPEFKTLSALIK